VALAVDDLHLVDTPGSVAVVSFLCEHLPPGAQLLVASRDTSALPVGTLRVSGRLLELGWRDLMLSREEVEGLMRATGAPLEGQDLDSLHERTEGWPAVVAFVLLALSVVVAPDRLRATRRAGWGLIAGGIVVVAAEGLTRRVLLDLVDEAEVRRAVGEADNAFLSDLGTWGAWVVAIGVVVLGTAIFLGSPLTLREHAARAWRGTTSRPARAWVLVLRVVALVVVVLLAIFALDAVLKVLVAVALGLVVAYGLAELLRLAGVGVGRPRPIAQPE
jgi:hypothetical protein